MNIKPRNGSIKNRPAIRVKNDAINSRENYHDMLDYSDNHPKIRAESSNSPDLMNQQRKSNEFDFTNKKSLLPMSENYDRLITKERKAKKLKKIQNSPVSQFSMKMD